MRRKIIKKYFVAGITTILMVILTMTLVPLTLSADIEWKSFTENLTVPYNENTVHNWVNPYGENVNFVIVTLNMLNGAIGERQQLGFMGNTSHIFFQDGGGWKLLGGLPGEPDYPVSVSGIGTPNISTYFNFYLWATNGIARNFTIEYRWGQSIRTGDFVCQRVWVNEKGNFQFVFWYPYRDNNWVRIYDVSGKMAYEIDMPYDNPNLVVDLPDGMYTVKTFHDQPEPLQEFIIGKP